MAVEIERKFLVKGEAWRPLAGISSRSLSQGTLYRQGYIASGQRTVRIRITGDQSYLTIKGPSIGISRSEYEYSIPLFDATEMLETLCDRPLIEKIRYKLVWQNLIWEIDEFLGENHGLVIAEVELIDPNQPIALPQWIGEEVSTDPRYFNSNLAKHPFQDW